MGCPALARYQWRGRKLGRGKGEKSAEHWSVTHNVHVPGTVLRAGVPSQQVRDRMKTAFGEVSCSVVRYRSDAVPKHVAGNVFCRVAQNTRAVFVQTKIGLVEPFQKAADP